MSRFDFFTVASRYSSLSGAIKLALGLLIATASSWCESQSADGQVVDSRISGRWSFTATDGSTGAEGDAVTLTWGIADDGSQVPDFDNQFAANGVTRNFDQSSLISFLDGLYDPTSTGGSDLTQRAWFDLFEQSTNRLSELSGVTFDYESADDGAELYRATSPTTPNSFFTGAAGSLGTRADIRIGGQSIDGGTGANTLAFNFGPNSGEQIIDTDNGAFFGNAANDSINLRNVVTHEILHGLGFAHVASDDAAFLLAPSINTSFDGPQLDEILLLQRNYGDPLESTNNQAGNDTLTNATQLGTLSIGNTLSVGQEVDDTVIGINEVGFVSIDDQFDLDIYEFTVASLSAIMLDVTPEGATYNQGVEGTSGANQTELDTTSLSDLGVRILDENGGEIANADSNGAGSGESISEVLAAGTYFAEVSGADNDVQLYFLGITAASITAAIPEPTSGTLIIGMLTLHQLRRRR